MTYSIPSLWEYPNIQILGTPMQVLSTIINACDGYIMRARGQRENWSDAPPRTYSYYIYIYMMIIIYNMVRAVYPEHICFVVHALCSTNSVLFFPICVCFEWMTTIWPSVCVCRIGSGKPRGKGTWGFGRCVVKRFLRQRWTERHLQRESKREI